MTRVLEGSDRPVEDMLENGVAFVPGFFSDDADALAEASAILDERVGDSKKTINDVRFGRASDPANLNSPIAYLNGKVIDLGNDSKPVRDGWLDPLSADPLLFARCFVAERGVGWHRDPTLLGGWLLAVIVIEGQGETEFQLNQSPFARFTHEPVTIHSNTGDLIIARGTFAFNSIVPYARMPLRHRLLPRSNPRKITHFR